MLLHVLGVIYSCFEQLSQTGWKLDEFLRELIDEVLVQET